MLAHRKQVAEENANNDDCPNVLNSSLIRLYDVPTVHMLNYELANFDSYQQQLPATASLATTSNNCLKLQVWPLKTSIYFILYCIILL